ncbi:AraC family transcriptional regulator ligand-binding domain-containing protein [Steroidobacter agaridevorans]|uniref:AraC family transcriptional regulator ligand-binding domain-containing protein n=1 Tax=Steroidobacter agaridevorans TaxID=2695856 RepID=UPI00132493DA|nr:AraC family transcriptional regulator ligand-binding domain-containing protein [Steroidobacter agaridevorans]GFE90697.1 HTH-type transcriptional regulator VirS [Steroidobacter agaridevorans]
MKAEKRKLSVVRESASQKSEAALSASSELASVRVDALRQFDKLVGSLGGDAAALLQRARIERGAPDQGKGVIPFSQMADLFDRASTELACPDFGLRLATIQAAHGATKVLGPLDVAMRNSPTLGEALRYFANHVHAYSNAVRVCFEKIPNDPRIFMLFEFSSMGFAAQRQAVEHALALIQHTVLAISGGQARAREIWFTHEPVGSASTYRSHCNATARFGQSMNGLFFDERDFDLALPEADPQLYEIATSFIDQRFPTTAMSLSERVRIIIGRLLVEGNCTHERVASAVGMHPRTLQRRLRDEGDSFEAIKDSVRRDVALRYLQQPNVSLVRVTEILGYSETSVLSRSCHRWFCASPRELRNAASR